MIVNVSKEAGLDKTQSSELMINTFIQIEKKGNFVRPYDSCSFIFDLLGTMSSPSLEL